MNQELIFKFKTDSINELTKMNRFLTQKSSIAHASLYYEGDIKNTPIVLKYLTPYEEDVTLKAIKDKKTKFKEDDVDYSINSFGYRDEKPIDEMPSSIGVWGCSYTFGVGVPSKNIFANILSDMIKKPIYNFGIPGAGIQKITKSFIINNNFFKFSNAFFVLPSLYRFEYLSQYTYDSSKEEFSEIINTFDFMPNWLPNHNRELRRKSVLLYELFDDVFFITELVKNLELIKQNAEINGTKLHFSTWCGDTCNFFRKYKIFEITNVQFLENNEMFKNKPVDDFARDGLHPGVRSHQATANDLYGLYKNIKPSTISEPKINIIIKD